MTLEEATAAAIERSKMYTCTVHVNASLRLVVIDGKEQVVVPFNEFGTSDWYDGTTVKTYTNGILQN